MWESPCELPNDELPNDESPRHFRRWGGLCAHTRKKKALTDGEVNSLTKALELNPNG